MAGRNRPHSDTMLLQFCLQMANWIEHLQELPMLHFD